jgi:hypothetical protein
MVVASAAPPISSRTPAAIWLQRRSSGRFMPSVRAP